MVEERELLNAALKTMVATVPKSQWVWGTRYIDDVVLRDENKDGDGDCVDGLDQRHYYTQDANFNVTALLDTAGTVVERVLYDAYGKSTLWNAAWSVNQASTLYNNEVLYTGYRLDPESGIYQVRHRHYHPTLGRWVQRDPIGYHDGMGLYGYVRNNPLKYGDPEGLQGGDPDVETWKSKYPLNLKSINNCPKYLEEKLRAYFHDAWLRVANKLPGKKGKSAKKDLMNAFNEGIHITCVCCEENECAYLRPPNNIFLCVPRNEKCGSYGASLIHELTHIAEGAEEGRAHDAEDYYYPGEGARSLKTDKPEGHGDNY